MKFSDSLFGVAVAALAFTSGCGGTAYTIPPVDAVVQPEPEDDLLGDLTSDEPAAETPAAEAPAADAGTAPAATEKTPAADPAK